MHLRVSWLKASTLPSVTQAFTILQLFQLVSGALHHVSTVTVCKDVFLCFVDLFAFIYIISVVINIVAL